MGGWEPVPSWATVPGVAGIVDLIHEKDLWAGLEASASQHLGPSLSSWMISAGTTRLSHFPEVPGVQPRPVSWEALEQLLLTA